MNKDITLVILAAFAVEAVLGSGILDFPFVNAPKSIELIP
jgi:hypothetical protein